MNVRWLRLAIDRFFDEDNAGISEDVRIFIAEKIELHITDTKLASPTHLQFTGTLENNSCTAAVNVHFCDQDNTRYIHRVQGHVVSIELP